MPSNTPYVLPLHSSPPLLVKMRPKFLSALLSLGNPSLWVLERNSPSVQDGFLASGECLCWLCLPCDADSRTVAAGIAELSLLGLQPCCLPHLLPGGHHSPPERLSAPTWDIVRFRGLAPWNLGLWTDTPSPLSLPHLHILEPRFPLLNFFTG